MLRKRNPLLLQAVLVVLILVFVNLVSERFYTRADLTAEGRYTLNPLSQQSLRDLGGIVSVKVYLDGPLPPNAARFRDAVRDLLAELKVHGGTRIEFRFFDPSDNTDLQHELTKMGIPALPICQTSQNEFSIRQIYPVAVLDFNGETEVINLLKGHFTADACNPDYLGAEQTLEYKFVSAIRRLAYKENRIIGFLTGQNQYPIMADGLTELREALVKNYTVLNVDVRRGAAIPSPKRYLPPEEAQKIKGDGIDVLVVMQPQTPFSERVKYELDQYLMRGGALLWILDQQVIDTEALRAQGSVLTRLHTLELDDLFMHYGFKVNYDLLQDLQNDVLPVISGSYADGRPHFEQVDWRYYPIIQSLPPHPVTRNVKGLMLRYASTIDTLNRIGLTHTILARSSNYSRRINGTTLIDLVREHREPAPDHLFMGNPPATVALLTEGRFTSLFRGREVPAIDSQPLEARFIPANAFDTRQIVISDGDLALYLRRPDGTKAVPMNNLELILNSIAYLAGDEALTQIRAKALPVRRLDEVKIKYNKSYWQAVNLVLPLVLLWGFAGVRYWLRSRKNKRLQAIAEPIGNETAATHREVEPTE